VIVSINQPAYLPWLGYFHRIAVADLHIVLDHVQFEKNGFVNRNKVRTQQSWCWLTVPLKTKGRFGSLVIHDLETVDDRWRKKHWDTIAGTYARTPFFKRYADAFEAIYRKPAVSFIDLVREMTTLLLDAFGIETELRSSRAFAVAGVKDELVLELCRSARATTYLSGPLGRNYLREPLFAAAGIKIVYQDYRHPTYPQVHGPFEPAMAAIDLLFNHGPASREILLGGNATKNELLEVPRLTSTAGGAIVARGGGQEGRVGDGESAFGVPNLPRDV
jgi:hypothetical protein